MGQMLKFGQIIDLSVLEKAGNAQEENAVQQRLRDLDAAHDDEISKLQAAMKDAQTQNMKVMQDNTKLLQSISTLTTDQQRLEKDLGQGGGGVSVADQAPRAAEIPRGAQQAGAA